MVLLFIRSSSFLFCLKFCRPVLFAHAYRLKTNSIFDEFHTSIFQIVQFLTCKIFRCVNFKCVCSPILLICSFGASGFFFKTLKSRDKVKEARILLSIVFWLFFNLFPWLNVSRLKNAIKLLKIKQHGDEAGKSIFFLWSCLSIFFQRTY